MPTLAEILAAKKAAAASPSPALTEQMAKDAAPPKSFEKTEVDPAVAAAVQSAKPLGTVVKTEVTPIPGDGASVAKTDVQGNTQVKTITEPVKEEPPNGAVKKLSFAEMMAAKKAGTSPVPSATVQPTSSPAIATSTSTESPKPVAPAVTTAPAPAATSSPAVPAPSPASVATTTPQSETTLSSNEEVSPEARQAYADIKEKINLLNTMSGDDLKNAMSNLKKALMANPAAISLMEDTDIGQMVIGLRKITGETISEAAAEKKPGRKKAKEVDLSNPDIMAQVFEEL